MKKILLTAVAFFGLFSSGQAQSSLNFDGVDDYVITPGNITHGNTFTYEAWLNLTTAADWRGIVTTSTASGQNTWVQLSVNAAGGLRCEIYDGAGNGKWYDGNSVLTGSWHHVAITFDGTTLILYVDGNPETVSMTNDMALGPFTINSQVQVGAERNLSWFINATIDEVRIWNVVRTQSEIQTYMNCPVKDNPAGLLVNYGFNDGIANLNNVGNTTLYNVIGNGLNGTLTNFSLTGASSNFVTDVRSNYFSQQTSIGSTSAADRLASAVSGDFNGDGLNDIIATSDNGDARLYLNGGKGNFPNAYTTLIVGGGGKYDVADIDNDGDMDFSYSNYTSTVKVFINNGSAVFTPISVVLNGTGAASITKMADINNDGKPDLIIGNNNNGATDYTEVWWNTGTTGNASFTFKSGLANTQPSKGSIAIGDIDGDGDKDIITGSSSWSAELALNNSNNGTFSPGTAISGYGGGVMLLDWDQDGKLDYLNYDSYNNYGLRFKKGDGAGNFDPTGVILLQAGTLAAYCLLSDINGDGFLDAITSNWGGDASVYTNNGCALSLQNGCNYTLGHADNGIVVSDFNNDGKLDVFCEARDFASTFYMNYLTPVITPALSAIITTSPNSICGTGTVGLGATASNSGTVNWYNVSSGGSSLATGTSYTTAVISATTTYYADATNSNGCVSSRSSIIATVNPSPTITISGTAAICSGNSTLLTASGATTYIWSANAGSATTATISANPSSTDTYTVTGDDGTCTNTKTITVNVTPTPTLSITGNLSLCSGTSTTLTANGGVNYTWTPSNSNATSIVGTPASTKTFTLTGSDASGNCVSSTVTTITVTPSPTLAITGAPTICSGNSTVLTGNGATNYTWSANAGSVNTTTVNVTPNGTDVYILTGANGSCTASKTFTVNVTTTPTVNISGTAAICSGNSTTLTAGGATTYTWSSNAASAVSSTVSVSPSTTDTYTVTGENNFCIDSKTYTVNVTATPTIAINGATTICTGGNTLLTASGATSYTWSSNAASVTTSTADINPSTTDTYTVTGDNGGGCINTETVTVTVTATPTISISGTNVICSGNSTTLTGNGATNYTWSANAGSSMTTTVTINPSLTDTYTLTGEDNGCSSSQTITVSVTPTPTVNIAGTMTICAGDNTTLTASGAATYTWSSNAGGATTATVTVNPGATDTYTVTGDDGTCTVSETITVNVNALPGVTFDMNPNMFCLTDPTVTLTATPSGGTFSGTGVTSGQFDPSTAGVGTYTLNYIYTDGNSCTNSDTTVLYVQTCGSGIKGFANGQISLYPNPATDQITLQVPALAENSVLEIYNNLGQKVISVLLNTKTTQLSLSNLNTGIYEARIISGNSVVRQIKFVKQ